MSEVRETSDVLVVGCGFAGFWSAVAARRVLGLGPKVTMVAPQPNLVIRPRLYQANPATLAVDVTKHLESVDVGFVAGQATNIDTAESALITTTGTLPYRRLVVATGSVIRRPPFPGAEGALSIDQLDDAIEFDRRLASAVDANPQPTVAVVGAGFTGIELALELRDRITQHSSPAHAEAARIVLIDRSPVVGAELGPGPLPVIVDALQAARIELRLDATVVELTSDAVLFGDGTRLDADLVALTTGMVASPFTENIPGERDSLGRVVVDSTLVSVADSAILVSGDAAHADTGGGNLALQSCQHALQLGRYAGENAARSLLDLPLVPYRQARYVTCLDLGRSGAVLTEGWDRAVAQHGAETKAIKDRINTETIYPPEPNKPDDLLKASEIPLPDPTTSSERESPRR